jgi:hypothetical protein
MLEACENPDLADEPELTDLGPRVSVEHLERYPPFVPSIAGEVDRGESALTYLALDLVAACESCPERGE